MSRHLSVFIFLCMLLALLDPLSADEMLYDVQFEGIKDKEVTAVLCSISQLISLKESPPPTLTALHRRIDGDIPHLIQGLRSFGYYNGKVAVRVDSSHIPVEVVVTIDTGPVYPLSQFHIVSDPSEQNRYFDCTQVDLEDLGVVLNAPALPSTIRDGELALLQLLLREGYPLAKITKRDVVADQATKTIAVTLYIKSGPQAFFGDVTITGCDTVDLVFIKSKIAWQRGDIYCPECVALTQAALEDSGLFSNITITHSEELDENGTLPIDISVLESYHRTIGFGASYTTQLGPGITSEWEHRNWQSIGQKLSLRANIWQRLQNANISYFIPDFCNPKQELIWAAEAEHETTKGFIESFLSFSAIASRHIDDAATFSYGAALKDLYSERSDNNRNFFLLQAPFQLKWSMANDLLDPTNGACLNMKLIPTTQLLAPRTCYLVSTFIASAYFPLNRDNSFVLATKLSLGTIMGSSRFNIPPPERFYAGSENTLRGYNYLTVSPLNKDNKPIGGRSLLIYTVEPRWRINKEFGFVAFYEVGNVYSAPLPQLGLKQLQSLGIGIRYHTAVGPLRFDLAVPLNRRKHVDSSFQFYLSVGQAF